MKKLSLALGVLALTGGAQAGFYIGGSAGVSHLDAGAKSKINGDLYNNDCRLSKTGVAGGIALGWQYSSDCSWAMAMELYCMINGGKAQGKEENVPVPASPAFKSNFTLQQKYAYGLRLLPGYNVNKNSRVSLIVDMNMGRFSYTHESNKFTSPTVISNQLKSVSKSHNLWGVGVGIQFLHQLNDKLALTGEYTYTMYKRSGKITDTETKIDDSYKPNVGRFTVGLRYSF